MRVNTQMELKKHRDELDDLVNERIREIKITQEVTIESMASLAEWRDKDTGLHIRRTQSFVRTLVENLVKQEKFATLLPKKMRELLYLSVPLHDVGKVCIPDHILLKPDKLNDEEFEIMKSHTVVGKKVLSCGDDRLGKDSFFHIASELAYCHHEQWDGKGYPQGLSGTNIPLSARLMSVADVYDAITSARGYKSKMPHEEAK